MKPKRNLRNRLVALLQLQRDNAELPRSFRVVQAADEATVYVYDVIGGWFGGVDAETFAREIAAITAKTIHLRVNSPGGDVFDARAMMAALAAHPAEIIGHVDGIAASAATSLLMAAKRIEMVRGGRFMIHEAWTLAMGNKRDFRATADLLEGLDLEIIADYRKRTKKSDEQIAAWMEAETWFSADQALEHGFIDEVVEATGAAEEQEGGEEEPAAGNRWNLAAYANAPEDLKAPKPAVNNADRASHWANLERRLKLIENTAG